MGSITSIDLFCGCGGFSLGLQQAGIQTLAAIDSDPKAIETFRANLSGSVPHILEEDLTDFGPEDLESLIGADPVDLIVGGPPCQGFSHVRRVDGANNIGPRFKDDPRRDLYRQFLRYVEHFQPKIFVMENVLGIKSAASGRYFTTVQSEARALGYRVHSQVVQAWEYGVPQKRRRQLFIGTKIGLPIFRRNMLVPAWNGDYVTLGEAIMDLPPLEVGEGSDPADYDLERRIDHVDNYGRRYVCDVLEVDKIDVFGGLTAHVARPHSDRDVRDFKRLAEGENSAQAEAAGKKMEFPYSRASFGDRYKRQSRSDQSSTIVAHLGKDGLMFIHPTQDRTYTPREAARVQSFPDWFLFPVARTHQFRLIGNAVPPLVGRAIGAAVLAYLSEVSQSKSVAEYSAADGETIELVRDAVASIQERRIHKMPDEEFVARWKAVCKLYPGLHPDSHFEHGEQIERAEPLETQIPPDLATVLTEYYVTSGWPVNLVPVLSEAWKRHERGRLPEVHLYHVAELVSH